MFGYIRPNEGNLLVKELELYKAIYCGLCSALHRHVSFVMPLTLNYDFVLLAAFRLALERTPPRVEKKRCTASPFKKKCRMCAEDSSPLVYTARASTVLSYYQLRDDVNDRDKPLFKRMARRMLLMLITPSFRKICRTDEIARSLAEKTEANIDRLSQLERNKSRDLDTLAAISGELLGDAACAGLEGKPRGIAFECGKSIGKWLYIIDAFDDAERDAKNGAFNPLVLRFGSVEAVKSNANAIDAVLSHYVYEMESRVAQLEDTCYNGIIRNITSLGLESSARKVLYGSDRKGKKDK